MPRFLLKAKATVLKVVTALATIAVAVLRLAARKFKFICGRSSLVGKGGGCRKRLRLHFGKDLVSQWKKQGDYAMVVKTGLTIQQFEAVYKKTELFLLQPERVRSGCCPVGVTGLGRTRLLDGRNQLAAMLHWLRSGRELTDLSVDWDIAQINNTVHHALNSFLLAMAGEIVFPYDQAEQEALKGSLPPVDEAIVIADGTYHATTRRSGNYSGHRHLFCRNHQVFCDSYLKIRFVRAGASGSVGDRSQIASVQQLVDFLDFNNVKSMGDLGYTDVKAFVTPKDMKDTASTQRFVDSRAKIEHLFARVKGNFDILVKQWRAPALSYRESEVFMACCILYNLLLHGGHFYEPILQ